MSIEQRLCDIECNNAITTQLLSLILDKLNAIQAQGEPFSFQDYMTVIAERNALEMENEILKSKLGMNEELLEQAVYDSECANLYAQGLEQELVASQG